MRYGKMTNRVVSGGFSPIAQSAFSKLDGVKKQSSPNGIVDNVTIQKVVESAQNLPKAGEQVLIGQLNALAGGEKTSEQDRVVANTPHNGRTPSQKYYAILNLNMLMPSSNTAFSRK